jgi:hypothetical protein
MKALLVALLALGLAAPAFAQKAADPPCDPATPAAMALTGLPPVAVIGRSYTVGLTPANDVETVGANGSTLAVHDRTGRGWSAHYDYLKGVSQAFSVGISGAPYTVNGSYSELLASGGTCTRTLAAALPTQRRILAVVNCHSGAVAPREGVVLRCDGTHLRLRAMRWTHWNAKTTTGHGTLLGKRVKVELSKPVECSQLDGYIYSRAQIAGRRIPIYCPLPD